MVPSARVAMKDGARSPCTIRPLTAPNPAQASNVSSTEGAGRCRRRAA